MDATDSNMYDNLIIADSRGTHLQYQLEGLDLDAFNIRLIIKVYSGAKIYISVNRAMHEVGNMHFDTVYLLTGVHDLSHKHSWRNISPKFNSRYTMTKVILGNYHEARIILDVIADKVGSLLSPYLPATRHRGLCQGKQEEHVKMPKWMKKVN